MSKASEKTEVPFIPHGRYLLCEEEPPEKTTSGGIVVPGNRSRRKERLVRRVVAVSDGWYDPAGQWRTHTAKVGSLVLTTGPAGIDVEFGGKKYRAVLDDEIIGFVTEDE